MKGTLHKTETGWIIEYYDGEGHLGHHIGQRKKYLLPIHPDYVKYYFLDEDAEGGEVEFEIIEEFKNRNAWYHTYQKYAKLINRNSIGNDGFHFDEGSTYPPVVDKLDKFMDNMELFERSTLMNILEELIKEAKAPLYTKEEVRKAIFEALALVYHQSTIGVRIEDVNEIIQSLKQPKQ